ALNHYLVERDGIRAARVFGDQFQLPVSLHQALECRLTVDERDHDCARSGYRRELADDDVAVADARVDHRLAADAQRETAADAAAGGEGRLYRRIKLEVSGLAWTALPPAPVPDARPVFNKEI